MADFERPSSPGGSKHCGSGTAEAKEGDGNEVGMLKSISAHYSALSRPTANKDTSAIRLLNNFVKSCILDATVRACGPVLAVADIACGRGQDFPKWRHAFDSTGSCLQSFYAMDLADTRHHMHQMAEKYIAPIANAVVTCMGDMSRSFEGLATDSVDIVSCQLCLHYLCARTAYYSSLMPTAGRSSGGEETRFFLHPGQGTPWS